MVAESLMFFADNVRYVKLDIEKSKAPIARVLLGSCQLYWKQPGVDDLENVIQLLRDWQYDGAPMQLHPGDLGWSWRFGPDALAAALRLWTRDEQVFAIGFLDSPDLLRLALEPGAYADEELARS